MERLAQRLEYCASYLEYPTKVTAVAQNPRGSNGEEFRDDVRRQRRPLPAEVLEELTTLNDFKATLSVLHTLGVLVAVIAVALTYWSVWVVIPAIILIASRQQACFVLLHEAAHYRLYESKWLNDLVGRALGTITGISMCAYRIIHRLHHNNLYSTVDPDMALVAGYPRGRRYLARKLLKDFTGLTAPKTYSYFFGAPTSNDESDAHRPLDDTSPALREAAERDRWVIAGFQTTALVVAIATGYGLEYFVLWILPAVTVLQALLRWRAICEHGAVADKSSPLTAARTNLSPVWLRWFMFPHNVFYHVEHHLYPAIPQYNLARCHQVLKEMGALEGAEVRRFGETAKLVIG